MPDEDEIPATLAGLRLRSRAAVRTAGKRLSNDPPRSQLDLLFAAAPPPAVVRLAEPEPEWIEAEPEPERMPERRVWSVRSLVAELRQRVESGYADVWVEGELSNCRAAPSGHMYLTLKDGEAQLPLVLFRKQAQLLRFRPADGMAVLIRGRLSVYESRGQLQLIAETIEPRGAGALQVAFEQLKAKLAAEGLFAVERKRTLPPFPRCVGIITSSHGAVLRDIQTVIRRRHARLDLLVYPATMQGVNCSTSVLRALRWFNRNPGRVDLIILARGGGSAEDLAGFNEETLARAIAHSEIPVVSAIGHETDFTIADFVADHRAPTPSAAAEVVTSALHRVDLRLEQLHRSVVRAGRYRLMEARAQYNRLSADALLDRLRDAANRRMQRIDELRLQAEHAAHRRLRLRRERWHALTASLNRQSPALRLAVGARRLESARGCLLRLATETTERRRLRLQHATARLEALSPVAVLSRGYALVYTSDGRLLSSVQGLQPGDAVRARLGSGTFNAAVTETDNS